MLKRGTVDLCDNSAYIAPQTTSSTLQQSFLFTVLSKPNSKALRL